MDDNMFFLDDFGDDDAGAAPLPGFDVPALGKRTAAPTPPSTAAVAASAPVYEAKRTKRPKRVQPPVEAPSYYGAKAGRAGLPSTPVLARPVPVMSPAAASCWANGEGDGAGGVGRSVAATPVSAAKGNDSVSPASLFDLAGDGGCESDASGGSGGSGRSSGSLRSTWSNRSAGSGSSVQPGRKSNIREEMLRLSHAAAEAVNMQMQQLQQGAHQRSVAEESCAADDAAACAAPRTADAAGPPASWMPNPAADVGASAPRYHLARTGPCAPPPRPPPPPPPPAAAPLPSPPMTTAPPVATQDKPAAPPPPRRPAKRTPTGSTAASAATSHADSRCTPPAPDCKAGILSPPADADSEEPRSDAAGGQAASCCSPGNGNLTLAERKKRNRESAERSRLRRLAHLGEVQNQLSASRSENTCLRVQVALAHQRIRYLEYVVEAQGGIAVLPDEVLATPVQRLWAQAAGGQPTQGAAPPAEAAAAASEAAAAAATAAASAASAAAGQRPQ